MVLSRLSERSLLLPERTVESKPCPCDIVIHNRSYILFASMDPLKSSLISSKYQSKVPKIESQQCPDATKDAVRLGKESMREM